MLIKSRVRPILGLIRVTSTDLGQFVLDEKSYDPDDWNPYLLSTPIYHTFFCSPKLCGKSGFYCSVYTVENIIDIGKSPA